MTATKEMKYDKEVVWMPHRYCSYGCYFCCAKVLRDKEDKENLRRNIENTLKFFDRVLTPRSFITLDGGEVSETPGFIELCEELTQKYYIAVYSNLFQKVWEQFADKIDPKKVDHIYTSIHPPTLDHHMDRFLNHLKLLKKRGFNIIANMILLPERLHQIPDIHEKMKELDVSLMHLIYYKNGVKYDYSPEEKEIVKKYLRFDAQHLKLQYGLLQLQGKMCEAGHKVFMVIDNGNVRKCAHDPVVLRNVNQDLDAIKLYDEPRPCTCPVGCACIPYLIRRNIEGMDELETFDRLCSGYVPLGEEKSR